MSWPQSAAPDLHLERARDCVGRSRTAWCADYWHIYLQPYEIAKNGEKTGGFAHVLAYKSPKTLFFAKKYLTRYTHETFFEEYTNFRAHYLSHCRDIHLQSFGSHIRPQPHGLGLTKFVLKSCFNYQWVKYTLLHILHFKWLMSKMDKLYN
jgi:hypothetical protein